MFCAEFQEWILDETIAEECPSFYEDIPPPASKRDSIDRVQEALAFLFRENADDLAALIARMLREEQRT